MLPMVDPSYDDNSLNNDYLEILIEPPPCYNEAIAHLEKDYESKN